MVIEEEKSKQKIKTAIACPKNKNDQSSLPIELSFRKKLCQ